MRFFINDSQFKEACSAIDVTFKLDSITTYVDSIELELDRLLGYETCSAILENRDLLKVMRRCIADLSLAAYTSSGVLRISNSGIQVITGTSYAPASDKKLMAFKRDAVVRGWSTFEHLIILLERAKLSVWLSSDQRRDYFSVLLSSSGEFGPFGGVAISSAVYISFRQSMVNIQDDYLEPVLGRDLLDRVIGFNTTSNIDVKDKQLQRLCMRVVAPQVVADALRYNAIELGENGVYQSSISAGADNVEMKSSASVSSVMRTINRLTMESESALVKLNKFLKANNDNYANAMSSIYPIQGLNNSSESNVYMM